MSRCILYWWKKNFHWSVSFISFIIKLHIVHQPTGQWELACKTRQAPKYLLPSSATADFRHRVSLLKMICPPFSNNYSSAYTGKAFSFALMIWQLLVSLYCRFTWIAEQAWALKPYKYNILEYCCFTVCQQGALNGRGRTEALCPPDGGSSAPQ